MLEAHRGVQVPSGRGKGHRQSGGTPAPAHPCPWTMDPLVLGHGRLLAKAPATLRTGVGALAAVGAPVGGHLRALPEAAPAVWARVGLLAGVGAHVAPEVGGVGEGAATVGAGEGGLPAVDPLVLVEGGALAEAAAAVGAAVGLLARVDPQVGGERGALREGPAAVRAAVWPLPTVDGPVLAQRGRLAEALATVRAAEGLLARVGVEMLHQGGAPRETLPAHVAAMPPVGSGDRGVGREWRATPARHLRWLLATVRKASREGLESGQPGKLSVHRKDLPQCLPPLSLSFFCLVSGTCWETRGELRPQLILVFDVHTHYGDREVS